MIYTLTVNPALDIILSIDVLKKSNINNTKLKSFSAGGKGFNVSRALNCLNTKNKAIAICGGIFGEYIKKILRNENIDHHVINIHQNTRANIKIIEKSSGKITELNNAGPLVGQSEIKDLLNFIKNINPKSSNLVLSGSLAPGINESLYYDIINICKTNDIKTLIDTSGKPLYHAILALPDILKINLNELNEVSEKYFNIKSHGLVKKLIDDGINMIMITNGAKEIRYYDRINSFIITPPNIKGLYATGSGDSVSAGLIYAINNNFKIVDMLKFSIACGSANILDEIPGKITKVRVQKLIKTIKVKKF